MKRSRFIAVVISFLLFSPLMVAAAEFRAQEQTSVASGEVVQGNLYMAGGNVSSAGSVRGDLVVAGGNLLINGLIQNDLLAGGGSVTVTAEVGGDVRIGGGTIAVQGKVTGDVIAGGGQVLVAGVGVGGDVAGAGGTVTITAPVNGNVKIAGGEIRIDAPIKGSVEVQAEKLTLGPKALISGDLTYTAKDAATMETGASVVGKTEFKKAESSTPSSVFPVVAFVSFALLAKFLMSLAGAWAFMILFRRYAHELARSFSEDTLSNLGLGFVTFIVLPIASLILLFTVVGIPIGVLGLLGYAALMIFASLVAPVAVGSVVHKWIWKTTGYEVNWWIVLMGVVVYFLLGLVPFIGWIVKFGIFLVTIGVVCRVKWSVAKNWR